MEFHFVFWKKQNLTKSSILSKVPFYPEKLSRLSEKFHFPNFPKFVLFFLVFDGFSSNFEHFFTKYSNLKSSILQISKVFWPKVPFYRKFHFILKNLVNFWKSSIFPLFLSLVTFSRVFCEFLFKIWKLQSFRFQNFTTNFQSSTKL